MEKISSFSGLLEEIITKPQGSPCFSLRAELDRPRAKRERAYWKFQCQATGVGDPEGEDEDENGHGGQEISLTRLHRIEHVLCVDPNDLM
ncbi:unnamed protein product [Miscanthus lutarioriparius]|uniref:Uncharacterized protein n=1 Tax=Miscanthus lutarioriparius TaxID=422564 RepID=A0A811QR97_9POAL|nr:unnamed protein product [Miscanthus lutarioriparius]